MKQKPSNRTLPRSDSQTSGHVPALFAPLIMASGVPWEHLVSKSHTPSLDLVNTHYSFHTTHCLEE